jgi:hypothetical protein
MSAAPSAMRCWPVRMSEARYGGLIAPCRGKAALAGEGVRVVTAQDPSAVGEGLLEYVDGSVKISSVSVGGS